MSYFLEIDSLATHSTPHVSSWQGVQTLKSNWNGICPCLYIRPYRAFFLYSVIVFPVTYNVICGECGLLSTKEEDGSAGNVVISLPIEETIIKYSRACHNMEHDISKNCA